MEEEISSSIGNTKFSAATKQETKEIYIIENKCRQWYTVTKYIKTSSKMSKGFGIKRFLRTKRSGVVA